MQTFKNVLLTTGATLVLLGAIFIFAFSLPASAHFDDGIFSVNSASYAVAQGDSGGGDSGGDSGGGDSGGDSGGGDSGGDSGGGDSGGDSGGGDSGGDSGGGDSGGDSGGGDSGGDAGGGPDGGGEPCCVAPPQPSCVVYANPSSVTYGGSSTITWSSSNATSAVLTQFGSVSVNGSRSTGALYATKTYTLTVSGPGGAAQCHTTVTVQHAPTPVCNIYANPTNIQQGDSSVLTWSSSNAVSASLSTVGSVSVNGTKTVYPSMTTTYTLTVYGSNGQSAQCSTTITVTNVPPDEPSCDIWADDEYIQSGEGTTVRWESVNAYSASLTQFGSVSVNGSRWTGALYATKTYTLTITGEGGSAQCQVTIHVEDVYEPDEPSCDIWADDTTLTQGESTMLHWESVNATSASLTQFGSVALDGSRSTGALYSTKTYTLTVSGEGGTAQCQVTIGVLPDEEPNQPSCELWADEEWLQSGEGTTLRWSSDNATSATLSGHGSVAVDGSRWTGDLYADKYYTLTVYGEGGSAQCMITIHVDDEQYDEPSCDIWADDTQLEEGDSTMIHWSSENASDASLSNVGSVSVDGTRSTGALYATRTYTLNVWGEGGSAQCSVTIRVEDTPDTSPYCTISASPRQIDRGESTTLSWDTENVSSAYLSNVGSVSVDGSRSVNPWQTTTYTLTVYDWDGESSQCSTTVIVHDEPDYYDDEPSCWIRATTEYDGYGYHGNNAQMTLTWGSENANSASISPNIGSVPTHGSRMVYAGVGSYTMTVWGPGGTATCRTQTHYAPPPYVPPQQPPVYHPPVYQPPTYHPIPMIPQPVASAYISLTQIPYTGFGLGEFGTAMYWLSIVLVAALGAGVLVHFRSDMFSFAGMRTMFKKEARSARLREFLGEETLSFTPTRLLGNR